ncbi:MAG: DMT family transporter [Rhodobacterales bacterium]|jgi:drug/metabolite transporter (DMT)-like permease|nr:DMT family transporter [Rhodobacter sp.]HBN30717.1 EamA/RhaT family transporter [Paracoccaceae bacterium]
METDAQPVKLTDQFAFGLAMIMLSAVFFGLVPFFARSLTEAGIAPPAVAFFRYLISPLLFFRFLVLRGPGSSATYWGLASGILLGLGWVGYVNALELMPVSTAGILYMTYPIFTLLISWLFFGDRPTLRMSIASGLILLAAIIAAAPSGGAEFPLHSILFALLAPFAFGIGINILTHKLVALPPISRMVAGPLGSAVVLLPLMATYPIDAIIPKDPSVWVLLIGIGVITATLPQFIYVVFAPKIGASATGVAGSVELPTMFLVGYMAFGEDITLAQFLAGALVLAAITLSGAKRVRNIATNVAVARSRKKARKN